MLADKRRGGSDNDEVGGQPLYMQLCPRLSELRSVQEEAFANGGIAGARAEVGRCYAVDHSQCFKLI